MRPILLEAGNLTVYSYGLFATLGFITGGVVTYLLAKQADLAAGKVLDYWLYATLAGLLGARLWYVAFRPGELDSFWQLFTLGGGGLALPGGILLASATLVILLRRQQQPILRWFDVMALGTMTGLAIGKVGSFLNGDGYGTATHLPWAVEFNNKLAQGSLAAGTIHPLQLYGLALYILIIAVLIRLYQRHAGQMPGLVFWTGLFLVAASQIILELWHAPADSLYLGGIRVIIPAALVAMAVSGFMLYRSYFRQAPKS